MTLMCLHQILQPHQQEQGGKGLITPSPTQMRSFLALVLGEAEMKKCTLRGFHFLFYKNHFTSQSLHFYIY